MSAPTQPLGLVKQSTTPPNPVAGELLIYAKSNDKVYTLNSAGTETQVGSGGGGKTFAFFMA